MKEGWKYKRLEEICSKGSSNISLNKIEENDGEYNLYGASGLVKGIDFYHQSQQYIGIVKDGSGVGRVNIYPPKSSLVGTMQYIFPNEDCEIGYLKYLLQGLHLEQFKTGAAIPHIYFKDYGKSVVPMPPHSEQQHIVEELDLLSSIIEKKKAQLNELDNLAQSLFYEMFGDPITNEKGWEVLRLGDKCQVSSFKRVLIEDVVDKGIPFIRGTELMSLSNGDDVDFTLFITPKHYEIVKEISGVPNIGDLLIPSINSKGNIWIVDTEQPRYYKDGRVLWVHVDSESYTSETLKGIMSILIQKSYSVVASGATFAELKLFVLRDLRTIIPPISIQHQYSEEIKAINKQKVLIKKSIKEVETLFNSRMDYYFN